MANFGFTVQTGTDQELLDLVRMAIATILATGQSYTVRGRTFERANLAELQSIERQLQTRIARAANGMSKNLLRLNRNP